MTTGKKENTKQHILSAAFKRLSESMDFSFSLSEIAKEIGVSKTAIFKHYKNKEALLEAMKDCFFDDFAQALYDVKTEGIVRTASFMRAIIKFLTTHKEYYGYLKTMCSTERELELILTDELKKRGIAIVEKDQTCLEPVKIYAFTTIVFYIIQYQMCEPQHITVNEQTGLDSFANSLTDFLLNGWEEIRELSEREKKDYDALCVIDPQILPQQDRFFSALMAVIAEHGFLGITIERIADKLGMAKSSLYAFFENKKMLMDTVTQKEMTYLIAFLSEKMSGITDVSGAVYVFLQLGCRYLMLRPAMIPIMVWHFSQGGNLQELYQNIAPEDVGTGLRLISELKNAEFNLKLPDYSTAMWLASLPTSLIIRRYRLRQAQFSAEEGHNMIAKMHWQMGHPLQNESECVLSDNFFKKESNEKK